MITWDLTERQAERLRLVLWNLEDQGPRDSGWASDQLEQLRKVVGYPKTWGYPGREAVDFNTISGDSLPECGTAR